MYPKMLDHFVLSFYLRHKANLFYFLILFAESLEIKLTSCLEEDGGGSFSSSYKCTNLFF